VAWYRLAADQGNVHGKNNLEAFKDELEERGGGFWESANEPVSDAAIEMVQRRARIRDLPRPNYRTGRPTPLAQENSADELANMGQRQKKMEPSPRLWNAFGTVVGAKPLLGRRKVSRRSCAPA